MNASADRRLDVHDRVRLNTLPDAMSSPPAAIEHAPEFLARRARQVDVALRSYLDPPSAVPPALAAAMRYSLEAGGKRLRPALVLECCALCGGRDEIALPAACAIECVHTFSLIHDDLPAMDNDDLRRGRATSHKVFGEALAILAGDGLLTLAFELIALEVPDSSIASKMVLALARGAGWAGMIGGQVMDLEAEGRITIRSDANQPTPAAASRPLERVREIHALKTAHLIATACHLGGLAAEADPQRLDTLTTYGQNLGLAFQAVDDLLDVTGDRHALGKNVGKDSAAGKQTLPRIVGIEAGWHEARRLSGVAIESLQMFGACAAPLVTLARFVVERTC